MSKKSSDKTRIAETKTVPFHVRLPVPLYQWLISKAQPEFKSPQKKVIEIVLAAQDAERQQELAAQDAERQQEQVA